MNKECGCSGIFLAVVILVFSFWQITYSKWIIVVAAALIFLKGIAYVAKEGCSCMGKTCCGFDHKTGEELFVEKNPKSDLPSKTEIKEVVKAKKTIPVKAKK
jgi:hypothetical protein